MLATCLQQLDQAKVRITQNRKVLLEVLHQAVTPISPPEIVAEYHRHGRRANKTTIYRELMLLEKIDMVKRVMVSDRKQYFELTERGHHHHLICLRCDRVTDIALEDTSLLRHAEMAGKKLHFFIQTHAIEFYGLCQKCTQV